MKNYFRNFAQYGGADGDETNTDEEGADVRQAPVQPELELTPEPLEDAPTPERKPAGGVCLADEDCLEELKCTDEICTAPEEDGFFDSTTNIIWVSVVGVIALILIIAIIYFMFIRKSNTMDFSSPYGY
tara:strand:+ start:2097 stop:2483 length:387 start_codon:yes stop_codon:yes gene_type:complete